MNELTALLSLLALLPAMVGPQGDAQSGGALTFALCGGGSVSVPLGGPGAPGSGNAPCCAKGCHSGQSRKRLDRSQ